MKRWQDAINSFTGIINNFPEEAKIFLSRGLAFQQLRNLQDALNDINKAVKLDPGGYAFYYFRAGIRLQMGDNSGYKSDLKTSGALIKEQSSKRKLDREEQDLSALIQRQLNNSPGVR